jgi:hypothetical protein
MKKNIRVSPIGLKGNEINERMKTLMGIKPINEDENRTSFVVELTKLGPDGKAYAIVRENHEYYIKIADKKDELIAEDFHYIGGLKNKKSEAYPSYAKAIKHLNIKFNSLSEQYNNENNINVFEDDNLLSESGVAGFSSMKSGFSGEGNLEGNKKMYGGEEERVDEESEMTEDEKAIDAMSDKDDKKEETKNITETHKLSIARAIENMDAIIDTLAEGKVKKKVYTIK